MLLLELQNKEFYIVIFLIKLNSYKKYLSLIMMVAFFSPILIKAFHYLYVHHDHQIHLESHQKQITQLHKTCPICSFVFVEFINDNKVYKIVVPDFFSDLYTFIYKRIYIPYNLCSFHLRAPPFI